MDHWFTGVERAEFAQGVKDANAFDKADVLGLEIVFSIQNIRRLHPPSCLGLAEQARAEILGEVIKQVLQTDKAGIFSIQFVALKEGLKAERFKAAQVGKKTAFILGKPLEEKWQSDQGAWV